jgi:hypothetical protein
MYHRDWLMRQIETITRYVFSLILGKGGELTSDVHLQTKTPTDGDAGSISFRLAALVKEEKLCEAENLLYRAVEDGDPEALTAGLRFYSALNELPDVVLERCSFPREEILSGVRELCAAYGYDLSVLGE